MTRDERGAGTVLAIAMMGLLVVVALGVTCGIAVVAAHRAAQSAADLAALAGAGALQDGVDACTAAAGISSENHAVLRACSIGGWTVSVTVEATARLPVGSVQLPARARAGPAGP